MEDNHSEQAGEEEQVECGEPVQDILFLPERRSMATGFESLDVVDLEKVFEVRALVMKSVPGFMKGAFRGALKISLEEIRKGQVTRNAETTTRGWKLFMLLPRMLLCRPPRGDLIPRKRLEERLAAFNTGDWVTLVEFSLECAVQGVVAQSRKRRRGRQNEDENRAARALHLAQMGELSSARQALEASPVATGNEATRAKLMNENRRPSKPRRGLDQDILQMHPHVPLHFDEDKFQHNLRTSRRGAAGGPSGMTSEHLRIVLDSPSCTSLLCEAASQLAQGHIPDEVVRAIRLGRLTALQKPDGGVRGIVVGDVFRHLVARTIAQQYAKLGEAATHPFQHALSTRAGTECVTHIVQALTSADREATILSIDGTSFPEMPCSEGWQTW